MSNLFYGTENQENITATDINAAYEDIVARYYDQDNANWFKGRCIVEYEPSPKSENKSCQHFKTIHFDCYQCDEYAPLYSEGGDCTHLSWCLYPTGRKWEITGPYEYEEVLCHQKED